MNLHRTFRCCVGHSGIAWTLSQLEFRVVAFRFRDVSTILPRLDVWLASSSLGLLSVTRRRHARCDASHQLQIFTPRAETVALQAGRSRQSSC